MHTPYWPSAFCRTRNRQQAVRRVSTARIMLALLWPLLPATAWAATTAAVPATVAAAQATIQFSQSKTPGAELQLNVKQALLADIIKEVAAKTKVDIHYSVLPAPPVTATCVADKVQQLLECLVGKQIGVVSQKPEGSPQEQVWLLGSSMGGCPATTAKAQEAPAPIAPPTPEQQAEADQAQQEHTQAMLKQAKSKNPDERFSALGNLADPGNQDPAIDQTLRDALKDKDANVRSQAVASMAMRGSDDMLEQLGLALQDADAGVRMAAIGATNDNGLLQQALRDKDPAVRGLAQSRLNQLERTAARQNQ
ncbi:HEAT repeat domain-containing protein [Methylomonas sp. 2BW1-5-20]|uniref:HEAT repeat domain-containing protein n=1 Tax=Methylomonas sp. 2BW1-5-20 TaxID=3376686 RepID=UPI00404F6AFA